MSTSVAVEVMAGGGVRPDDVRAIVAAGIASVHLSARAVAGLDHAAASAGSGNAAQMVSMLKKVMQTPEGAALLDRLSSQLQR